jgi:alkyldihydroxyacetonephosphate synthase
VDADRGVPVMRWWGWGEDARAEPLPAHALHFLREEIGLAGRPRPPVALARVRLPESGLADGLLAQLREIVGSAGVRDDHAERVRHAAGKGYPDLVRLRAGEPDGAPDAVVYPTAAAQLRPLLEACASASVAVVPFGGGTSVVGGVAPIAGRHAGVVSLDLSALAGIAALDLRSRTATVLAGTRGPALEASLAARGLTLGHFPQSFEYVSIGGCVATRSAGQASSGYGSIERMVLGLRLVAPAGEIALPALPATAAGPGLRQLLVGSEGTLGVISEVDLRVRAAPEERLYEGAFFPDVAAGVEAFRELALDRALPDVARLSDAAETRMSLALAGGRGVRARLGRAYLSARGMAGGCLAILGFEGTTSDVGRRRRRARAAVAANGGIPIGRSAGEAWLHARFATPYLRDELLTHGIFVETLETAAQWSELLSLHRRVGAAIAAELEAWGTPGLVACHVSHIYETGASLYFTFLARQREDDAIGQWLAVKRAASDAIVAGGGTITHHHGVGRDHAPWMEAEIGTDGLRVLTAVKAELDPAGIMNPGKLLPLSSRR